MKPENTKKISDWLDYLKTHSQRKILKELSPELRPLYASLFTYLKYQNEKTYYLIDCGLCQVFHKGWVLNPCEECIYCKAFGNRCGTEGETWSNWTTYSRCFVGKKWEAVQARARDIYRRELVKYGLLDGDNNG